VKNADPNYAITLAKRPGKTLTLAVDGTVSIEEAAEYFGIDSRRLRGWIFSNQWQYPIGDMQRVYPWSVERFLILRAKQNAASAGALTGAPSPEGALPAGAASL
jgi:hypothetical protein